MHIAADLSARLVRAIEDIKVLAERADGEGINRVLDQLTRTGDLDDDTIAFIRRVHALLTSTVQTLTLVIEANHIRRGSSDHPGFAHHTAVVAPNLHEVITVDAAEAWRRAHLHLPSRHDAILIHIQEFEEGYQAIPVPAPIAETPRVPSIDTPTTLVIDKITGAVTRWPLLPLDVLAKQYRRYQRQEPMDFDDAW